MKSEVLRKNFIKFWTESPRNAKEIPNVSLVPNVDSTLLFVNSGMFPLVKYLSGEKHPLGKRLCNIQRCLRTNYDEIIEIGDNRHTLMFEMMGDWSLGDFFKEEQIPWILEFYVEVCGLDPNRLYVSVFEGDQDAPKDSESIKIWKKAFSKYNVKAEFCEDITKIPKNLSENWKYRIFPFSKKKNWWERAHFAGELGGPNSEIFYDMGIINKEQEKYNINDDSGRFIEIGNNVFMQYNLNSNLEWVPLEQKNIDFGGGFERLLMIIQGKTDIFETDVFEGIIKKIEKISQKKYKNLQRENEYTKSFRIIADHVRASTFILGDGIVPSNKDQGYILRRFIRRMVRFGKKLEIEENFTKELSIEVINTLKNPYPQLYKNQKNILEEIEKEEKLFRQTLEKGLKKLKELLETKKILSGKDLFYIYETYGFPLELTLDELNLSEENTKKVTEEFKTAEKVHREKSKTSAKNLFKGGLADSSIETTKLHTAHHLLLASLKTLIDQNIKQKGSNITKERLRLDFNFHRKLTPEEIKSVEDLVNQKIDEGLRVQRLEMPKKEAEKLKAEMEFGQTYPDTVTVYIIGGSLKDKQKIFSKEFCGGPHVKNTIEIKENSKRFKIFKEESSGSNTRRIKAGLI